MNILSKKIGFLFVFSMVFFSSFAQQPGPWEIRNKKYTKVWNLTDEFNGGFDWKKWKKKAPYGFTGRNVSLFTGSASWISGKRLVLGAEYMKPTNQNKKKYIKAGYVCSAKPDFKPGYYCEARIKASNLRMGSDFWFIRQFQGHGNFTKQRINIEVDVTEGIGGSGPNAKMKSNVHCFKGGNTIKWVNGKKKSVANRELPGGNKAHPKNAWVNNIRQFHTYGFYYESKTSLKFYLDGKFKFKVNPECSWRFTNGMYLIFSHETYDWIAPPAQWQVKQKGNAKRMEVDWVRTWKVENKKKGSRAGEEDLTEVNEPTELNLETYPNPIQGDQLNLDLTMPEAGQVQLEVLNSSGGQVYSNSYADMEGGIHNLEFTLGQLNIHEKGLYLIKVSANGSHVLKKVIY